MEFGALSLKTKEAEIRKYFISAIALLEERFRDTGITCNALITLDKLQEFCPMDDSFETLMKIVFDRILRVARNITDIDGSEMVRKSHVAAVVQCRSFDHKYWNE